VTLYHGTGIKVESNRNTAGTLEDLAGSIRRLLRRGFQPAALVRAESSDVATIAGALGFSTADRAQMADQVSSGLERLLQEISQSDQEALRTLLDLNETNQPLSQRRIRASQVLGLRPDSFRKSREQALIRELASRIMLVGAREKPILVDASTDSPSTRLVTGDLHGFLTRYFSAVAFDTRSINSFDPGLRHGFDQFYIDQWLERAGDAPLEQSRMKSSSLLDHFRRAVIIGDPGSGKTTLLIGIARELAAARDGSRVPILVQLRDYAQSGDSLATYLEDFCRRTYQLQSPEGLFKDLLELGHAVLLLDGLDEIADVRRGLEVANSIEHLANLYPQASILVTSRPVPYRKSLDESSFTRVELTGLDAEQSHQLLLAWFSSPDLGGRPAMHHTSAIDAAIEALDRLECRLNERVTLQPLVKVPLFLVLLCRAFAETGDLPRSEEAAMEQFIRLLVTELDRDRGIDMPAPLSAELVEECTRTVAEVLRARDWGTIPEGLVTRSVVAALGRKGLGAGAAHRIATAFLEFCRARSWVLTELGVDEAGEPRYGFTHAAIEEFFTRSLNHEFAPRSQLYTPRAEPAELPGLAVRADDALGLGGQMHERPAGARDQFDELVRLVTTGTGALGEVSTKAHAPTGLLPPSSSGISTGDEGTDESAATVEDLNEDRHAGDQMLALRVQTEGTSGPTWFFLSRALVEYGYPVMRSWIQTRHVWRLCLEKGIRLMPAPPAGFSPSDVEELAHDTLAISLTKFQLILEAGKWDPAKRVSLKTYFVAQCLIRFPDVYAQWLRRVLSYNMAVAASIENARLEDPWSENPEELYEQLMSHEDRLAEMRDSERDLARVLDEGFSQSEIADALGISKGATDERLGHLRKKSAQ
jgi:hypothetical protein